MTGSMALSSRGLGRRPLTAVTRVRLPLGLNVKETANIRSLLCFCQKQFSNIVVRTYVWMAKGYCKYDWSVVQRYYDEGNTFLQCRARFGFARDTWRKAVKTGRVVVRPRQWPIQKILAESRSRYTVKRRLLDAGILINACSECGLSAWRGCPLTIQIDHKNGIRDDHRLENLRMLCPNCHSQTETYAARNRRRQSGKGKRSSS